MKQLILSIAILIFSFNSFAQQILPFGGIEDTLRMYNSADSTFNPNIEVDEFFSYGDTLYVGGRFAYGGIEPLMDIGKWDGQNWHKMGFGVYNGGGIRSILRYKGQLYAGGETQEFFDTVFTAWPVQLIPESKSLARWNDSLQSWEALPSTYGGLEWSEIHGGMTVCYDTLFIGADAPQGAPWSGATRVVGYDADINNYIDVGKLPSEVHAIAVLNGEVYAGGTWISLKKYVGGTGYEAWQDVGGLTNYYINAMDVDTINNFLYVAGGFWVVDDTILTDEVAIWNGYYWEKVGYGYNVGGTDAMSVKIYNGDVYVGKFGTGPTGGVEYNSSLLRWDGQDWHAIGEFNNGIMALEVWKDTLYIGGNFDSIGGQPIYHKGIARLVDTIPNCRYLKPRIYTDNMQDTFYLPQGGGTVDVPLYNNNAYADSWSWDFDDGTTDTVKDPLHTYSQTGVYTVQVTVTEDGCTKTAEKDIVIMESTGSQSLSFSDVAFKIYPNPTRHDFTVEVTLPETVTGENKFFVTGMNGTIKYNRQLQPGFNRFTVGTAGWQPATYLCNLVINGKFVGGKKLMLTK